MNHDQPNRTTYVLGFAFDYVMEAVVLIEKQKPDWQRGKLNGVGGKVENWETVADAMCREFCEETGVAYTRHADWIPIETMKFKNGAVVHCFASRLIKAVQIRSMEQEKVDWYPVDAFDGMLLTDRAVISNLNWLVPKAYHQLKEPIEDRMIIE